MVADWMPGARKEPVQNFSGPMSGNLGLVLHVQEGNGDLQGWFNNPSAQASSHFQVRKDGTINQFVPMSHKAWAQGSGNADFHSIESEGFTTEPLTDAQMTSIAAIYKFGGWPVRLSESPSQSGLGWHGMGGNAWGGHFGCPGDIRKGQRAEILRRVGGAPVPVEEDLNVPTIRYGFDVGHGAMTEMIDSAIDVINPAEKIRTKDGNRKQVVIKFFQAVNNLGQDGLVGPKTFGKLMEEAANHK